MMSAFVFLLLCFASCHAGKPEIEEMNKKCNGMQHYEIQKGDRMWKMCNSVKDDYQARYGRLGQWNCKLYVKSGDAYTIKVKIITMKKRRMFIHILIDHEGNLIGEQKGPFRRDTCISLSEYWENYGNPVGGTRYSPLLDINVNNVKKLKLAWTYRYGTGHERYEAEKFNLDDQSTPIMVEDGSKHRNDVLISCTPLREMYALDPSTGVEIWRNSDGITPYIKDSGRLTCRGVATWLDPLKKRGSLCKRSIYLPTVDHRLIAVDAATGKRCTNFGVEGFVDLKVASPDVHCLTYMYAPAVVMETLILGQRISDDCGSDAPKGLAPAFHARTGKFMWKFMIIPTDPDDPAMKTYRNGTKYVGSGNAWAPLSGDNELGLVYMATSSANLDHMGTHRIGDNHYCDSVVALNATDGKLVWFRQLVHHDVFDYDLNNQPVIGEITRRGKRQKVVLQGTKMGFLFVLNAETGDPVFGIKEHPVPSISELPGEIISPTQPFPVDDFLRLAKETVDMRPGKDLWGRTPADEEACIEYMNNSGIDPIGEIFMPARFSKASLWVPGVLGGMIFGGGVALDPTRSIAVAATQNDYWIHQLFHKNNTSPLSPWCKIFMYNDSITIPYADCYGFSNTLQKCNKPPWAMLHAIDLNNGRKLWTVPNGLEFDPNDPSNEERRSWSSGGILLTGGGLVIAGNTDDRYLRAFNIDTGELLYQSQEPMIAMAVGNPITYRTSGKQYIVITASGYKLQGLYPEEARSDHVYAFALLA
ncbi:unnamed protein product [Owenia fusiformis]|uniref:Pyrrolo-quinoline quinone repeat domain-containing protein n=1 Tax=Owenia fusiformis TaxID=6347 RepID=A0A8J1UJ51_OWEFU|nr:unnamed protein product [Owenia fusiformis]